MYSNPDSQPLPYLCIREGETDINIDITTERLSGQSKRQRRGGHGRPRQCMTPTPPPLSALGKRQKERERETGLLGDLAQCKHSTICCSDIWSGLAKSDSEREKSAQEDQCKTTVQEETGEWGEGESGR